MVVDDAQWADAPSLRALLFAVRRLVADRVLVLLVVREGEADARCPTACARRPAPASAARPARRRRGARPRATASAWRSPRRGARRLHEHSGGSPLHARALLAEVPARAAGRTPSSRCPRRGSLAELVAARLRALRRGRRCGCSRPPPCWACARRWPPRRGSPRSTIRSRRSRRPARSRARRARPGPGAALRPSADPRRGLPGPEPVAPRPAARRPPRPRSRTRRRRSTIAWRRAPGPTPASPTELEALRRRGARASGAGPRACTSLVAAARLSASRADRERRLLDAVEAAMYAGDNPRARALAEATRGLRPEPRGWTARSPTSRSATGGARRPSCGSQRAWEACGGSRAGGADRRAPGVPARSSGCRAPPRSSGRGARAPCARDGQTAWSLALGLYYTGRRAEAHAVVDEEARRGVPLNAIKGGLLLADDELDAARDALRRMPHAVSAGSLVIAARALAKQAQLEFAAGEWDEAVVLAERAATIAHETDEVAAQALAGWASVLVPAARGRLRRLRRACCGAGGARRRLRGARRRQPRIGARGGRGRARRPRRRDRRARAAARARAARRDRRPRALAVAAPVRAARSSASAGSSEAEAFLAATSGSRPSAARGSMRARLARVRAAARARPRGARRGRSGVRGAPRTRCPRACPTSAR